jgi:MFS family permease
LAHLFAHRAYVLLWFARIAGTAGNQMLLVAVGWQMYDLTGSAWDLGLVGLLQFLPAVVCALPAGALVDRFHRARIVSLCMVFQVMLAGLLWSGAAFGFTGRGLLLTVSVGLGMVRALQMPAQQALTPSLVPAEMLPRAMAFSAVGMQGAIIAGPALGGFVYVAGASAVYALCALLFVIAGVLCAFIRYEHTPPPAEPANWHTLLAGVRFIFAHKVVLGAISLDLFAVLLGGATALLPMFAKDVLHVGPWGLGLLRGAPAAGAILN